jgi:hypothetical protein
MAKPLCFSESSVASLQDVSDAVGTDAVTPENCPGTAAIDPLLTAIDAGCDVADPPFSGIVPARSGTDRGFSGTIPGRRGTDVVLRGIDAIPTGTFRVPRGIDRIRTAIHPGLSRDDAPPGRELPTKWGIDPRWRSHRCDKFRERPDSAGHRCPAESGASRKL